MVPSVLDLLTDERMRECEEMAASLRSSGYDDVAEAGKAFQDLLAHAAAQAMLMKKYKALAMDQMRMNNRLQSELINRVIRG